MTQNYMDIDTGKPVPGSGSTTTCLAPGKKETLKAPKTIPGTKGGSYSFLFWDTNGKLRTRQKVTFTAPSGGTFTSTAWYLYSGVCTAPPCGGSSNIFTYGFQVDKNQKLSGTPIASVTPSTNKWKSPSQQVFTDTAVTITAANPLEFIYWKPFPKNPSVTAKGTVISAAAGATALAIAFYGPNPCQYIIDEEQSLSPGDFPAPNANKLYAEALHYDALQLKACEAKHGV